MLYEKTKNKYILNIVDHFSKYLVSYLIQNKTGKEIIKKIEDCIKNIGRPKQILSDNGSEFISKNVKNLLEKNKINFIHGKPYNPHSQGTIQRVHRTVRNALICKYLGNPKNFILYNSLKDVVDTINHTIHYTTRFTPVEVFFFDDKNLFNTVRENTLKSSKNYYSTEYIFKKNDNILLYNNFESKYNKKDKHFILEKTRMKNKNVLYNICATIINDNLNGIYPIIIEKDYEFYNLNKNDICLVKSNMIKKVEYKVWLKILNN